MLTEKTTRVSDVDGFVVKGSVEQREIYTHTGVFFPELSFIFMIILWNKNLLIVFVSWPNLV